MLTKRQRTIVDYIATHQERNGISPTIREICSHLGLKSPAGVHKILSKLIEKKIVISTPGKNRSIRLAEGYAPKTIPLLGIITAGVPDAALENREEELSIDPSLFGTEGCFALRVGGDSMIDDHIMYGDLAIIKPRQYVENGQIAAVQIDHILPEATLKRVYWKKDKIELHSANSAYKPLVFKGKDRSLVQIIGEFVGLIRRNK